jgi:hypothetical protein
MKKVLKTQNFKGAAAQNYRRAAKVCKNLLLVGLALIAVSCGRAGDSRNSSANKPPMATPPTAAANKPLSNVETKPAERKKIISGVMPGMPDPSPRSFERWLYGNRALSGAKWQKPEGHVPGQYVAKYTGTNSRAELFALLNSGERLETKSIQYVSLSVTSVADVSSKTARDEVLEVSRAVFGREAGNKIALAMESEGGESPPSGENSGKWRFTIAESYNGVSIDIFPPKKE